MQSRQIYQSPACIHKAYSIWTRTRGPSAPPPPRAPGAPYGLWFRTQSTRTFFHYKIINVWAENHHFMSIKSSVFVSYWATRSAATSLTCAKSTIVNAQSTVFNAQFIIVNAQSITLIAKFNRFWHKPSPRSACRWPSSWRSSCAPLF